MKTLFSLLFIFLLFSVNIFAQSRYECGMIDEDGEYDEQNKPAGYQSNPPQTGGQLAPAKTLNGSYVKILVIFAQFEGDNKDIDDDNWPKDGMPVWANSFLGTNINQAPYPANTLSNYFYQMSNGQNHVIGYVYPQLVKVNAPSTQYYGTSNLAVLQQVDANPNFNFNAYDQWNMMTSYQQVFNQTDGYVDAVYIIWRNIDYDNWGGIADLGLSPPVYQTNDGVKIDRRIPTISMTVNIGKKSQYTYQDKLTLLAHEYGHYLFGAGHNFESSACGGNAQRGIGLMCSDNGSLAMNPHEKYLLGYTTYTDIFYDQTGQLPDFQSTGSSFRIPIPLMINGVPNVTPNEFFIIANHQKLNSYEQTKGAGVYIYHVKYNYYGQNHMDIVTAEGLWQWAVNSWITQPVGLGGPMDWYCRNSPDRTDPSKLPAPYRLNVDRVNGRDELQEVVWAQYPVPGTYYNRYYWWDNWYDKDGNLTQNPLGTANNAFNMGYNELFSPWSNPATLNNARSATNTAVHLTGKAGSTFNVSFYTTISTSQTQAPPAKPQNIQLTNVGGHPVLNWEANIEPDLTGYRVYKKLTLGAGGTQTTYFTTSSTTYTDDKFTINHRGYDYAEYWVVAVDNTGLLSVESDHKNTTGSSFIQWKQAENNEPISKIDSYDLSQCYPNPFNPSTQIDYSIKEDGFVILKIYDVLGNEVATLVNEPKTQGNYSINFDASHLPSGRQGLTSGVYIYTLQVNDYFASNKMILAK